jgi:transposase
MDGQSDSVLVQRLDVVQVGRRRRWSDDEKLRIVSESYEGYRQVSAVARRHEISRSQLYAWRRALGGGARDGIPGFSRAVIVPTAAGELAPSCSGRVGGRMEVVTRQGDRITVGADVDGAAFARVLGVLEARR